jgi:hypothetical protein
VEHQEVRVPQEHQDLVEVQDRVEQMVHPVQVDHLEVQEQVVIRKWCRIKWC